MSYFDALPRYSFAGIPFPVEEHDWQGGIRDHVHEYSHADGGDPEKLGRKLNVVRVTANFHNTLKRYPGLYPNGLDTLVRYWEQQTTAELVIPTRGTFQAYARNWTIHASAKVRSGERVTIEFVEDNNNENALIELVDDHPLEIQTSAAILKDRVAATPILPDSVAAAQADQGITTSTRDIFDSISALATAIFAIQDTADLTGQLYAAKLGQLAALCERVDGERPMQHPGNRDLVEALHALWAASLRLFDNANAKQKLLRTWLVPVTMTMGAVAVALYRDAGRTEELLALNSGRFVEAMAIPAGTTLVYYPDN